MTAAPKGELAPGTEFGPYTIVRQIGRGAFGVVYEATRNPVKRRVALKVLHEHVLKSPEATARFERESFATAQIEHPHVVDVIDGGLHDGTAFLAMEFLEGESLSQRLKREGKLPLDEIVDVVLPLVSALGAVHATGIVHRDIKPGNIFLTQHASGMVHPKLLDFGIAKVNGGELELTQTHAWLGTPYYMSPEQIRQAKEIDARTDQWSLAVVLYEATTGWKPFPHDVLLDLLKSITGETPPSPSALNAALPKGFDAVVMRMLERDPDRRFASMLDVGEALFPFASERVRALWAERFGARHASSPGDAPYVLRGPSDPNDIALDATLDATALDAITRRRDDPTIVDPRSPVHDPNPSAPSTLSPATHTSARPAEPSPPRTVPLPYVIAGGALVVAIVAVLTRTQTAPREADARPTTTAPTTTTTPAVAHATIPAPPSAPPVAPPPAPAPAPAVALTDAATVDARVATAHVSVPFCDNDPTYEAACGLLQAGNRDAAYRAFLDVYNAGRAGRAAVALGWVQKSRGRWNDADERLQQALDSGDAWVSAHRGYVNGLLTEVRSRVGWLQINCPQGEALVGPESNPRTFRLPMPQPIRWGAGRVRVVVRNNNNEAQQYVTVRYGEVSPADTCPP